MYDLATCSNVALSLILDNSPCPVLFLVVFFLLFFFRTDSVGESVSDRLGLSQ